MHFQQYLHQLDDQKWNNVLNQWNVKEEERQQFHSFIEKLKQQTPEKREDILSCRMEKSIEDDIWFPSVTVSKDGKEYAIDFIPWDEVLGYQVDEESLQLIGLEAFAFHVLYDMSFDGFEEGVREARLSHIEERLDREREPDPIFQALNERYEKGEIDYGEIIDYARKKLGL